MESTVDDEEILQQFKEGIEVCIKLLGNMNTQQKMHSWFTWQSMTSLLLSSIQKVYKTHSTVAAQVNIKETQDCGTQTDCGQDGGNTNKKKRKVKSKNSNLVSVEQPLRKSSRGRKRKTTYDSDFISDLPYIGKAESHVDTPLNSEGNPVNNSQVSKRKSIHEHVHYLNKPRRLSTIRTNTLNGEESNNTDVQESGKDNKEKHIGSYLENVPVSVDLVEENSESPINEFMKKADDIETEETKEDDAANSTTVSVCAAEKKQYPCSSCEESFAMASSLRHHLQEAHNEERCLQCPICSSIFPDEDSLEEHSKAHSSQCSANTDKGEDSIASTGLAEVDDESENDQKEDQVEIRDTPSQPIRKKGRRKFIESKYKCPECNKAFCNSSNLTVHMRTHRGEKPFSCTQCSSSFTTKNNLHRHERTHLGLKPFECKFCKKCFTEKKSLTVHLRTHTGERPFVCKTCGKGFTQSGILQTHEHIHTGWKGHLCDYCGKSFRQKSQLAIHQKRHTGMKPFSCLICDMAFINSSDLKRHELKHTGARPFLCFLCPKSFTRLQYLKEHTNQHMGKRPYTCRYCNAGFHDIASRSHHEKKHSSDVVGGTEDVDKELEQQQTQTYIMFMERGGDELPTGVQYEEAGARYQVISHEVIPQVVEDTLAQENIGNKEFQVVTDVSQIPTTVETEEVQEQPGVWSTFGYSNP